MKLAKFLENKLLLRLQTNKINHHTLKLKNMLLYNCRGLAPSLKKVSELCKNNHIILLQETWLSKQTLNKLDEISNLNHAAGSYAEDRADGLLRGRPLGGTAVLRHKRLNASVCCNSNKSIIGGRLTQSSIDNYVIMLISHISAVQI